MALLLGIDGGGTGLPGGGGRRGAAASSAAGEAASANIWTDPDGARGEHPGGRAGGAGGGGRRGGPRASCTRCWGSPAPTCAEAAARLAGRLPFARRGSRRDALIALKGALGDEDGITATLGTGSVFGVQRGGAVRMIGGWGFLLGDQGSGARIGRALLEAALLAHDGLADADAAARRGARRALGGPAAIVAFGQRARAGGFRRATRRGPRGGGGGRPCGRGRSCARRRRTWRAAIDRLMADGPAAGLLPRRARGRCSPERLALALPGADPAAARARGLDGALAMAREAGMSALFAPEAFAESGAGRSTCS